MTSQNPALVRYLVTVTLADGQTVHLHAYSRPGIRDAVDTELRRRYWIPAEQDWPATEPNARDDVLRAVGCVQDALTDWAADAERILLSPDENDLGVSVAAQPVTTVQEATDKLAAARDALADADGRWRAAIRAALADGQRVVDIAEAAGISRERVYQIRDGRR